MADSKLRELSAIVSSPENMSKNPVSLLLEAAAHVGESANFNDVDELAISHMKLFTCEVKVGRLLKCRGTGPNKKTAKANAAESALEKIRNGAGLSGNSPRISQQVTPARTLQLPSPAASVSPNTGSSPINSLQEMCVKNNWPPPSYDLISETGEPHMKTFICECKVGSVVAQGQGKAKKTAKKLSAENALSMITQGADPMSPSGGAQAGPSSIPFRSFPGQGCGAVPAASSPASHRMSSPFPPFLSSQLYDTIEDDDEEMASYGGAASGSFIEDISEEFCSLLEGEGKKSGFSIEYHDISEKGYSGNYLCFVKLNTKPPAVCSGMGPTKSYAHERAAKNALQYLSTVCG